MASEQPLSIGTTDENSTVNSEQPIQSESPTASYASSKRSKVQKTEAQTQKAKEFNI